MQIYVSGSAALRAGLTRCRLRVNLRYRPSDAVLTLRGALTGREDDELRRVLAALAALPAPVHVVAADVAAVDPDGLAVLTDERDRRVRAHLPPLVLPDPLVANGTTTVALDPCDGGGESGMPTA